MARANIRICVASMGNVIFAIGGPPSLKPMTVRA
jgi:hypothetical protein